MAETLGHSTASSNFLQKVGTAALSLGLIAAGAYTYTAGKSLKNTYFSNDSQIDLSLFEPLTALKNLKNLRVSGAQTSETLFSQPLETSIAVQPLSAPAKHKVTSRKKRRAKKVRTARRSPAVIESPRIQKESISVSKASPIKLASKKELETVRGFYFALRSRFRMAAKTHPDVVRRVAEQSRHLNTHKDWVKKEHAKFIQEVKAPSKKVTTHKKKPSKPTPDPKVPAVVATQEQEPVESKEPVQVVKKEKKENKIRPQLSLNTQDLFKKSDSIGEKEAQKDLLSHREVTPKQGKPIPLTEYSSRILAAVKKIKANPERAPPPQKVASKPESSSSLSEKGSPSIDEPTKTSIITAASPKMSTQNPSQNEYSASNQAAQSAPKKVNTHPGVSAATVQDQITTSQARPERKASQAAPAVEPQKKKTKTKSDIQSADSPVAKKSTSPHRDHFIDAFTWKGHVPLRKQRVLSYEGGARDRADRWEFVQAKGFYKTLFWNRKNKVDVVPMLSRQELKRIAVKPGVNAQSGKSIPLHRGAGFVLGKVARGWSVEFSGRSESVIYLNRSGQKISQKDDSQDRYFVYLNAEPGAQLLYVVNQDQSESGAVALPVFGNTVSYVNLTEIRKQNLKGIVLDGADPEAEPLSKVKVNVIGQTGASGQTDENGEFSIPQVVTLSSHTVYIDTEDFSGKGFTHRYQYSPDQLDDLYLFRFTNEAVGNWLGQLSGGLSPESGLVIAALPSLAVDHANEKLFAEILPTRRNPTLIPENYSLSQEGRLLVQKPMDFELPRFVSVQVPNGFNIVQTVNDQKKVVWSALVRSQPGVINVVGP